jgi:zinc protease
MSRSGGAQLLAAALCAVLACASAPKGAGPAEPSTAAAPASQAAPATSATAGSTAAPGATPTGAQAAAKDAIDPPLPGEERLREQPKLAPLADFAAPVPKLVELPSGLRVYVVERPGAPLESLALVVRRGSTADPAGLAGLATLSAAMLEAGSAGRSQAQIAAQADAMGAALRASATLDATLVALSALPSRLPELMPLLADVALRPNLDPAEWKKLQGTRTAELQAQLAEPRVAAGLAFAAALYGDGPLGRPAQGTPASVAKIRLADVKAFLAGLDPHEAALIAVGAAPQAQVVALATRQFSQWKSTAKSRTHGAKQAPAKAAKAAAYERPRLVAVDFGERPQTVLAVGQPAVPRSSPDALALRLLNSVLGGSFTSRLNQNLREQHGYTYGAGSRFMFGRLAGPFVAQSSVKAQVTGPALAEILGELEHAVAAPITSEELEKGKALLAYELVETLQSAEATAGAIASLFVDELPLDELQTTVPRLRALTVEAVQAAVQRTLQPATMTIVLAGDLKAAQAQFQEAGLKLPPPQLRAASGEVIKSP